MSVVLKKMIFLSFLMSFLPCPKATANPMANQVLFKFYVQPEADGNFLITGECDGETDQAIVYNQTDLSLLPAAVANGIKELAERFQLVVPVYQDLYTYVAEEILTKGQNSGEFYANDLLPLQDSHHPATGFDLQNTPVQSHLHWYRSKPFILASMVGVLALLAAPNLVGGPSSSPRGLSRRTQEPGSQFSLTQPSLSGSRPFGSPSGQWNPSLAQQSSSTMGADVSDFNMNHQVSEMDEETRTKFMAWIERMTNAGQGGHLFVTFAPNQGNFSDLVFDPLINVNGDTPMSIASNKKVVTAYTAIYGHGGDGVRGSDYRFNTYFSWDAQGKVLHILSDGDPYLQPEDVSFLGQQIKRIGIHQINELKVYGPIAYALSHSSTARLRADQAGESIADVFRSLGINVNQVRAETNYPQEQPGTWLFTYESLPLSTILKIYNTPSNNFISDQLYRTIGMRAHGSLSLDFDSALRAGAEYEKRLLQEVLYIPEIIIGQQPAGGTRVRSILNGSGLNCDGGADDGAACEYASREIGNFLAASDLAKVFIALEGGMEMIYDGDIGGMRTVLPHTNAGTMRGKGIGTTAGAGKTGTLQAPNTKTFALMVAFPAQVTLNGQSGWLLVSSAGPSAAFRARMYSLLGELKNILPLEPNPTVLSQNDCSELGITNDYLCTNSINAIMGDPARLKVNPAFQ